MYWCPTKNLSAVGLPLKQQQQKPQYRTPLLTECLMKALPPCALGESIWDLPKQKSLSVLVLAKPLMHKPKIANDQEKVRQGKLLRLWCWQVPTRSATSAWV